MKGVVIAAVVLVVVALAGMTLLAPGLLQGSTAGIPLYETRAVDVRPSSGVQAYSGDLKLKFDHTDAGSGATVAHSETSVKIYTASTTADTGYKLKKNANTATGATIGINSDITQLFVTVAPAGTATDLDSRYFVPDDAVIDNPGRVTDWMFDDISGNGEDEFVLIVNVQDLDSVRSDADNVPNFRIDLTWRSTPIAAPTFATTEEPLVMGTGEQRETIDIALGIAEETTIGISAIKRTFDDSSMNDWWDETKTCMVIPGHPTSGNKLCLDDMDKLPLGTSTIYTYEYGSGELNDLNYISVPTNGNESVDLTYTIYTDLVAGTADDFKDTVVISYVTPLGNEKDLTEEINVAND